MRAGRLFLFCSKKRAKYPRNYNSIGIASRPIKYLEGSRESSE